MLATTNTNEGNMTTCTPTVERLSPPFCDYCEVFPATTHLDCDGDGCAPMCAACDAGDFSDIVAEYEEDAEIMEDCRYIASQPAERQFNLIDSGYTTKAACIAIGQIVESIINGTSPLYPSK